MITRDSIETAYSFLHQKRNVYVHSSLDWQRDDIEYAVASYAEEMNRELFEAILAGQSDFLADHGRFLEDITRAVERLEEMMEQREHGDAASTLQSHDRTRTKMK